MDKVSLELVNYFILGKQHLTEKYKSDNIVQIAKDILALHATLPKTPYLSLFARAKNFTREQLDEELYVKRNLGKIRFVRKTIHILPREMISIGYSATRKMSEIASKRYSRYLGVSREEYDELSRKILEILKGKGMTTTEIKKALETKLKLSSIINLMCDQGLLIRGGAPKRWQSNVHVYHLFQEYFPDIDLNEFDEENAKKRVIKQYVDSFGPVTLNDVAWWTSFRKKDIRQILESLQDELTYIEISDLEGSYIISLSDQNTFKSLKAAKKPIINLLPALDPYMMGYKDRERYLSNKYYYHVFDRSGNATSSILLNGEVIGIWDLNKNEVPQIRLFLFEDLEKNLTKEIYSKSKKIGKFIVNKDVEVKELDSMVLLTERTQGGFMSPLKE